LIDGEAYKIEDTDPVRVDVNFVDGVELDIEAFKLWRNGEYTDAEMILGWRKIHLRL
jgi:leucyl-tRNA synthetase